MYHGILKAVKSKNIVKGYSFFIDDAMLIFQQH